MPWTSEPLQSSNQDEVVAYFRQANPLAQKTWGRDTGRFMDWRWGANALVEEENPDWLSANCRVYRYETAIRAISVAEYGRESECIITGDEDPDAVRHALRYLIDKHAERGMGVGFEISGAAEWPRTILRQAGLLERADTGHEWEYDLATVPTDAQVPDGFSIESLTDDRESDYAGIADCIRAAFKTKTDHRPVLRSLESNPLFRQDLSVFARSPDGRIAAYCRGTVDPDNGVCGIDPVCCHPDFQRMGLSKAVVQTCFGRLRDLGGRFCYIGSGPEPAPGTHLYRSLGPSSRTDCCVWAAMPDSAQPV